MILQLIWVVPRIKPSLADLQGIFLFLQTPEGIKSF